MGTLDMLLNDGSTTMVGVLVFLAAATLTFSIMAVMRVQGSVKRRTATIGRVDDSERSGGNRSLRHSSFKAAQRVLEYTTKHYSSGSTDEIKVLRRRMTQAGIYDPRAVAYFFLGRTALHRNRPDVLSCRRSKAVLAVDRLRRHHGYLGLLYIDKRIARKAEHQAGFPDFMTCCGLRRRRAEHGGIARSGRPSSAILSVAHRQPASPI